MRAAHLLNTSFENVLDMPSALIERVLIAEQAEEEARRKGEWKAESEGVTA